MDKEDVLHTHTYTHTHTGILVSHKKKNEILSFATTWMDLESIMLNEISQTEKDKCCMISLICGILKKWYKWTYLGNRNRPTDIENKLTVTKGKGGGGGIN